MIKKLFKRGLSLLLALVLVVTTFFIFDPSVLKLDADAYVDINPAEAGSFLADQTFYATETIYLKAGKTEFQYYENYSYATGAVTNPVDATGSVYFNNDDAYGVTLYVNNVYERSSKDQVTAGSLTVNTTKVSTYAGMANGTATPNDQATKVAEASGGKLNYQISSGALTGYKENGVYIIEWVVAYKTKHTGDTVHYAFAYTGIYAPFLGQAGITYDYLHSSDDARQEAFSFVTGVEAVAGGNAKSNLVSTSNNGYLAPLMGFVGKVNSADGWTVAGGANTSHLSENGYFTSSSQGGVAATTQLINRDAGDSEETNGYAVTNNFNDINTFFGSDGKPSTVSAGSGLYREGYYNEHFTTGVGYITVDKSRYTNYNQIPNLSVGWLELHSESGTESNGLNWIRILNKETTNLGGEYNSNYSVSIDELSTDNGTNDSMTSGLYKINGPVMANSGLLQIVFRAKTDRNRTLNDHAIITTSNVGLYTTTWSQDALRRQYNEALNSFADYQNLAKFDKAGTQKANYATNIYNQIKATGEELADPTAHKDSSNTVLATNIENAEKVIREGSAPTVYFYVPEVIYLNPIASSSKYNFQYYVDREQKVDGNLNKDGEKTTGNIYFYSSSATSVKSLTWEWIYSPNANGGVTVGSTASATGTLNTTITGGYTTTYETYYIQWTLTYTTTSGQDMTVTAFTCCYPTLISASNHNGVISATSGARRNGSRDGVITTTGWIVGAHTVDSRAYVIQSTTSGIATNNEDNGVDWDHYGAYISNWLKDRSSIAPTAGSETDSSFASLYNTSLIGGSGYWASDGSVTYDKGGKGTIIIDSSRYSNLNQIPNLYAGVDANNADKSSNTSAARHMYLDVKWYGGSSVQIAKQENLPEIWGGQSGARQVAKINASVTAKETGAKTVVLTAHGVLELDGRNGYATCYLLCNFVDKTPARTAHENTIKQSQYLQKEYFTDTAWNAYYNAVINNASHLLNPSITNVQSSIDSNANDLRKQTARLAAAVVATTETYSYTYTKVDGTSVTETDTRANVLKTGTATVYHVLAKLDDNGNLLSVSDLPGATAETATYYFGETVDTGYNNYQGYNYFGYHLDTTNTAANGKWTQAKGISALTGDKVGQNSYGVTGANSHKLARTTNVTYTYVYTENKTGVYMDWGESEQAFLNKTNLADITNSAVNGAFTGDDTSYTESGTNISGDSKLYDSDVSQVSKTDKDSFSFNIKAPGYNSRVPNTTAQENLFPDFSSYSWEVGTDRATITANNATESFTIVGNGTNTDIYTYWGGASRGIKGIGGHTYKLSFDVLNNSSSAAIQIGTMWFTYAKNDTNYESWGQVDNVRAGSGSGMTVAAGAKSHYEMTFTVPVDYPNFSVRIQLNTANGSATYSNIGIYDISDSSSYAKMTDLFFPNVATGLTAGKTYTIAFKSSLRYDEYRWYRYNENEKPMMDWSHEQGTIQMFATSTNSSGNNMVGYDTLIRVTTAVSEGGTIGTFTVPEGCSNINLGFCITNDTAIGGWVEDIRIVEGDYVELGTVGKSYTMPDPQREGYTFTGWSQKSTPFYGSISGTKNSTYTYGIESDTVLANWQINKYDITFDNEFDFDQGWSSPSAANGTITVNKDTNSFVLETITNASSTDNNVLSTDIVNLVPGHRYRVSYDYNATQYVSGGGIQNHIFLYGNETDAKNNAWSKVGYVGQSVCPLIQGAVYPSIADAQQGTVTLEFVAPENVNYARIRLGNTNKSGMKVEFSDIYWQDISRGTTTVVADTTVSEPKVSTNVVHGVVRDYKEPLINNNFTTLPTMTSDAYFFNGWYTEKTGGVQVTDESDYRTKAGTNQLWSRWQVHIEYDISGQGGAYLDASKAPQTSAKYDVGATVNAKIADYVPYKVGYNFAGWKDKFQGGTYQPGQIVDVLNYSLILEPIWVAATDVSKDTDYEAITELHPGQVYYYAYTPAANNELVSGYVYGSSPDLTVTLYKGNQTEAGYKPQTLNNEIYGVQNVNSIVTDPLTKGTEYYYGITAGNTEKVTVSGEKFKVSEHKVSYTLDGGSGTPASQTVEGHYNTDLVFETPVRTGHTFMNWNTAPGMNNGSPIKQSDTNALIDAALKDTVDNIGSFVVNQTMHAAWSANTYTMGVYAYYNYGIDALSVSAHQLGETGGLVRFGAKSDANKLFKASETAPVVYGDQKSIEAAAKTGYTFKGWYDAPTFDANGNITSWGAVKYEEAAITTDSMPDHDVNLYARFDVNTYVVTLRAYSDNSANPGVYSLSDVGGTVKLDNLEAGITATQTYVGQYKNDAGEMVNPSYTMTAIPKAGYVFDGWYFGENALADDPDNGNNPATITLKKDSTSNHACDHTYTAKFSVQMATLTANANGGTPDKIYEDYMGASVELTIPVRDGYDFDGWNLTAQGGSNAYGQLVENQGVYTYTFGAGNDFATAKWKIQNYPITIDPAGGEVTVSYYYGDEQNARTETFDQSKELEMAYMSTASLGNPTKVGYNFDRWVETNNEGELVPSQDGGLTLYKVGLNDAAVITATWTVIAYPIRVQAWGDAANSEGTYTNNKGGTVTVDGTLGTDVELYIDYGTKSTLVATPETGYEFRGWTTAVPSTQANFNPVSTNATFETEAMGTAGLNYYAVFAIKRYTVSLDAAYNTADDYENYVGGTTGGTVKGGGTFSHGQGALIEAIPSTSYVFKGWYNGDEEVAVNPKYTVTVTDDVALTARFAIKEYTVSTTAVSNYANNPDQFDGNDAAGTFTGRNKYYHGQTTSIIAAANPGYVFVGWFSDYDLKNKISGDEELKVDVTSNITYYAKFEVLKVSVNLYAMSNSDLKNYTQNTEGGSVSYDGKTYAATASGECYFGGNYTVYAKPETGYTFDGWYTDESLSGTPFTGSYVDGYFTYLGTANVAEGAELYAKFSVGAYELNAYAYSNTGSGITNYDNNNVGGTVNITGSYIVAGSEINEFDGAHLTVKVYFNKTSQITATPKAGYKFAGWYTDRGLKTSFSAESSVETQAMGVNGLNYYAKFEVDTFTIVYDANGGVNIQNSTATAYYNTAFTVAPEFPTWAGHTFIGWSTTADGSVEYQPGATIEAGTISDWYENKGGTATLYAQWTLNANFLIATSAFCKLNGVYNVGTEGGTVEVVTGPKGEYDEEAKLVVVPEGEVIESYLKFSPATGYALSHWCYSSSEPPVEKAQISSGWGYDGTGQTAMPAHTTYVVAFFLIKTFDAEAKAYYNTAANPDQYNYGATGGTVKLGRTGKNASNAVSENKEYGSQSLFIATAARGYDFLGWYAEPENNNGVVAADQWNENNLVTTSADNFVTLEDDSIEGKATVNNYYAVFSIKAFKATASVKTYNVREDLIYSLADDQFPYGIPSADGGKVGLGLTSKADESWAWSGSGNDPLNPSIDNVYYGVKVYFEAVPNSGYFFGGWYTKTSRDENVSYFGDALVEEEYLTYSRNMRDSNMFMEAKFVPVSFTLVLDANGGVDGNPTEILATYGVSLKIEESSVPTKTGSTFKGWADAPDWTATETQSKPPYQAQITIVPDVVNGWYDRLIKEGAAAITIYAIWDEARVTINLDKQGATGGDNNAQVVVGSKLPILEAVPEYEGFVFGGYYGELGGKGVKYYNADGTPTAQLWNNPSGGTIHALWTCPVLESIDYNKATGEWVYTYRDENGGKTPVNTSTAVTSAAELTKQVASDSNLMWWTKSVDTTNTSFVTQQIEKTPEINLNHYSDSALTDLRAAVIETDTAKELGELTQPQANAYVARMAKDMELDFADNKKGESNAPTIKLYETASKINTIKSETIIDGANSANGSVYSAPSLKDAATYAYAGKWSYTEQDAVDYYLYTNSPNPVIALEIGDGDVASTVASNASSYPTKATVTDNAAGFSYVNGKYETSAVQATKDLEKAWFAQYTKAGIGTAHDYNAKTVIYLTPEFTSSGTQNEIVYTIKASDDAYVPNEGVKKSELGVAEGQSLANMQVRFDAYNYDITRQEDGTYAEKVDDIKICICYHNSMNGDSDEGTPDASGDYMQMYMDQVDIDKKINQLHLFRTSGGASNWEFPTAGENVYPVEDRNYPYSETGYVLGSFMYVFDSTNEATAAAHAASGDYASAKQAIIDSVKGKADKISTALKDKSDSLNINSNKEKLGVAQIVGWSANFYPKTDSYVYVHLVDRWGNVFNRVWKCYNVDSYPSEINRVNGTSVYNVFEDGGSNIDTVTLDGADVEFILDDTSSYENGVFTTTGNSVSIATGEANKTYNLTITDKATNTNTVEVTTDGDGVLVLNVEDTCADLSAGAYTFTLNGETVNLYSGVTKLVYSASITEASQVGAKTVVTVKASKDVVKLQLVEGGATRTYAPAAADSVVENEDGTFTWTLSLKPSKGAHSYALKAKTLNGWETTEYTLETKVIDEYVSTPVALKSVYNANAEAGEKPVIKARTLAGTQKLQLVYPNGATITYNRSDDIVITTVDGVETWALTGSAYGKAGEYEVTVRAKYNNQWQDASAKISTVTVTEKTVDTTPVILSVEAQSASAEIYDYVTFKVVTNSNSTKIRFNYPGGFTSTFAENAENTVVNADGTKTWTVAVKFYTLGENDITFSTRNADGWVDAQNFGTIEITK